MTLDIQELKERYRDARVKPEFYFEQAWYRALDGVAPLLMAAYETLEKVRNLCEPIADNPPSARDQYDHGKYIIASRVMVLLQLGGDTE